MGKFQTKKLKGFSIIEVLLSIALFSMITLTSFYAILSIVQDISEVDRTTKANGLLESTYESLYTIKESKFTELTVGTFGIDLNDQNKWVLTPSPIIEDGYTKTITIKDIDKYTKEALLKVTWKNIQNQDKEISLTAQFSNWKRLFYSFHDWTKPFIASTLDLPGTSEGVELKTKGDYLYVARHGSTNNFCIIDVADSSNPVLKKCLNIPETLNYIQVSNNYVILSSSANNQELTIVNVSNPVNPVVEKIINLPGSGDAWGTRVEGNYLYVNTWPVTGYNEFYIIDFTIPSNATILGSMNVNDTMIDVAIFGNYAYLATNNNSEEIYIINISNKSNPIKIASIDLPGTGDGFVLHTSFENNRLVATDIDGYVSIFDLTNPESPVLQKDYLVNGRVGAMAINYTSNYAFLATVNTSREFQVLKITDPYNPTVIGFLNLSAGQYGLAYNSEKDVAYLTGAIANSEIIIIKPANTLIDE